MPVMNSQVGRKKHRQTRVYEVSNSNLLIFTKLTEHIMHYASVWTLEKWCSVGSSHYDMYLQLSFDDPANEHQILRRFSLIM